MHILPNISRSKGKQAMIYGQLIEYIKEIFFFKNNVEGEVERLVPGIFLFARKALYQVKASGLQLSFNIYRQPSTWLTIKTSCVRLQSRDILNFDNLEKVSEQFLYHIFCIIFQEKCFSCYILLTDQIQLKAFFIIFIGLSVTKNCLKLESAPIRLTCTEYVPSDCQTHSSRSSIIKNQSLLSTAAYFYHKTISLSVKVEVISAGGNLEF